MVTELPTWSWSNVFQFTADGGNGKYGDCIPALFINKNGHFQVCSAVNGDKNYCRDYSFVLGRRYHFAIKQYEDMGKYFFEIIIDDVSLDKIENSDTQNFPKVKLFASNPWDTSFFSYFGNVCNFRIVGAS